MLSRFCGVGSSVISIKPTYPTISNRFFLKGGSKTKNNIKFEDKGAKDSNQKFKRGSKDGNGVHDKNIRTPKKSSNFNNIGLISSGVLFAYGVTHAYRDISRLKKLRMVSLKEFEKEYLLNGEAKQVYIPGYITSFLSDVNGEVILHQDNERNLERIGIITSSKMEIIQLIQTTEKNLGVAQNESVKIKFDVNDIFLFGAFFLAQFIILKRQVAGLVQKKPFTMEFRFEMKNDKPHMEERNKTLGKYIIPPKTKPKIEPKKTIFDFMSDYTVEEYREKSDIKFKDVAGLHSAKQEVREFLEYLNNPGRFIRLGARLPRGAMLLGPPGCGKTLLIKALANESKVPFFYKAGSEFVDVIGGVGAQKIRKLFAAARNSAPSIIFLDEIDSIGKKRGQSDGISNTDSDQTLNQLLVEMDGMDPNAGIVVFAATNRSEVLDTALIRPGRLDRHILIDLPVLEERKEMFELYLNKFKTKLEGNIIQLKDKLALQTPGMTGADIANLCNEAALTAARLNYTMIKDDCFDQALERIIAGAAKKNRILNEKERTIVAYHEAGHVIVGWLLKYADPVLKVSIVPRTNAALGFAQISPIERYLLTTEILSDKIAVLLGGRAAEFITFNRVTTGAHDDLRKVKKLAFSMIREWGMSENLGHLSFQISEEDEYYGSYPYSKSTGELIESEANMIVSSAYKRAESILRSNVGKLELLAKELLAKEVLKNADIQQLIGARPFDVSA